MASFRFFGTCARVLDTCQNVVFKRKKVSNLVTSKLLFELMEAMKQLAKKQATIQKDLTHDFTAKFEERFSRL